MATSTINKFSNDIVMSQHSIQVSLAADASTKWEITGTKSGYTPMMFDITYGYSAVTILGAEYFTRSSGSFALGGFGRSVDSPRAINVVAHILWKRNS